MIGFDAAALADLLCQAKESPRRRSHLLLHGGHNDPVQRLVIALRRGTYVRPHVHSHQWEMLTLLRGACDILFFDATGQVISRTRLAPTASSVIQIPQGQVHGAVAMDDDTVVIETKPGPYRANEFMDWAPQEGDARTPPFLQWLERAKPGEGFAA
jgi:cupin fold WbuC family metalloprotein